MSDRLTKKKKATKSKKELWAQIEDNFIDKEPIECIYRTEGERETCDICKFSVRTTENGFLACSNPIVTSLGCPLLMSFSIISSDQ